MIAIQSLTHCSGRTDGNAKGSGGELSGGGQTNGMGGVQVGSGGEDQAGYGGYVGPGGHTGHCFNNPCGAGCGPPCGGIGGGGMPTTVFGGHTSACLNGCGPGCPFLCMAGNSGAAGMSGSAGEAGAADGGEAAGGAPSAQAQARVLPDDASARAPLRACYTLTGYDADPCLPPDDAVLGWLEGVPATCTAHVASGPFQSPWPARACCYDVTCEGASSSSR